MSLAVVLCPSSVSIASDDSVSIASVDDSVQGCIDASWVSLIVPA